MHPLSRNGRAYFSVAHVVSVNSGCETQLLAPCFGAPTGLHAGGPRAELERRGRPALNGRRGGWFSADGEYGSGLSSGPIRRGGITCAGPNLAASIGGPCKRTPHMTFNVEDGIAVAPKTALTLGIQNLLNDRYFVTLHQRAGQPLRSAPNAQPRPSVRPVTGH